MAIKDDLIRNGMWAGLADAIIKRTSTSTVCGTPGTSVTATEYGDDYQHVTVLTFSGIAPSASVAGAAKGVGKLVYTFPAGTQVITHSYISVGVTAPTTGTDTTKIGLGSVIASGAVSALNGTATFMDILTEQTGASAGVAVVKAAKATSSPFEYITQTGGVKAVNLNVAATWTDTGALSLSGTVTLRWLTMA
jgi:hypothetical protein